MRGHSVRFGVLVRLENVPKQARCPGCDAYLGRIRPPSRVVTPAKITIRSTVSAKFTEGVRGQNAQHGNELDALRERASRGVLCRSPIIGPPDMSREGVGEAGGVVPEPLLQSGGSRCRRGVARHRCRKGTGGPSRRGGGLLSRSLTGSRLRRFRLIRGDNGGDAVLTANFRVSVRSPDETNSYTDLAKLAVLHLIQFELLELFLLFLVELAGPRLLVRRLADPSVVVQLHHGLFQRLRLGTVGIWRFEIPTVVSVSSWSVGVHGGGKRRQRCEKSDERTGPHVERGCRACDVKVE